MKNLIKLITLAVIAALAFSCAPPLEETDYDWKAANARNDASKTDNLTDSLVNAFDVAGPAAAAKNPEITIVFPQESDFLRASNFEAGMKEFLTVHNFEAIAADTDGNDGKINALSAAVDYTLLAKAGNAVTIKVNNEYTGSYSNLVIKIDGTKYKHSHGLLLDKDRNGKAGEAGYDDVWLTKAVTGATITGAVFPGNRGWSVTIAGITSSFSFTPPATGTTTDKITTLSAATITAGSVSTTSANGKAIFKDIADLVAGNIKLEKLEANGGWTTFGTAVYDAGVSVNQIIFKDVTFAHDDTYRITWAGNGNLETANQYYGVKQRLYVAGVTPNTGASPYNITKTRYSLKQVSGTPATVRNTNIVTYLTDSTADFSAALYSFDSYVKNAIIDVTVPWQGQGINHATDPYVGLDGTVISNLAKFKTSFKIVYSPDALSDYSDLTTKSNLTYIDITKVEGISENFPGSTTSSGINTLRITLDPAVPLNVTLIWVPGHYEQVNNGYHQQVWVETTYKVADIANEEGDDFADDIDTSKTYYTKSGDVYTAVDLDNDTFNSTEDYYEVDVDGYWDEGPWVDDWQQVWVGGQYNTSSTGYYYFLIDTGFGYTGGKYLYGDPDNYKYNYFALYSVF